MSLNSVGIGPAKLEGWGKNDVSAYHLLYRKDFDIFDSATANISNNLIFDEEAHIWINTAIGARYFFPIENFTPFIGAHLGLGLANNLFGFIYNLESGFQVFRSSDVHFELCFNYLQHQKKDKINSKNPKIKSITASLTFPSN